MRAIAGHTASQRVNPFVVRAQMGGPEGVRKAEQYTLVTGLANGMLMHAVPRINPAHAHIEE